MRRVRLRALMLAGAVLCCALSASAENSVVVTSKAVALGETGVTIPILLTNDETVKAVVVPLALREQTPGAFVTSITMSFADRLPVGGALSPISFRNQYANEDGTCKQSQPGGFGTVSFSDGGPNPVVASPEGVLFARQRMFSPDLLPGTDATGSFVLTLDVTSVNGTFEIDSTCANPSNHVLFADLANLTIIPSFTKGIINIGCQCPFQTDFDADGFLSALDLNNLADLLFAGQTDIQDPNCPKPRSDCDCDGFPTVLDLGWLVDHLYAGGPAPCQPCSVTD